MRRTNPEVCEGLIKRQNPPCEIRTALSVDVTPPRPEPRRKALGLLQPLKQTHVKKKKNQILGLRGGPPPVVEEPPQRVDLRRGHRQQDQQVDAGPEGHPPQVVLQQVAVPRLHGPQEVLEVPAPLQTPVDEVHGRLSQGGERRSGQTGTLVQVEG